MRDAVHALVTCLCLTGCSDSSPPASDGPTLDGRPREAGQDLTRDVGWDRGTRESGPDAARLDGSALDGEAGLDAATGPLRVATFNCYCLKDNPAQRIKGIAQEIHKLDLDVIGLQEVCETPGGSDNSAKAIAAELKTLSGVAWEHLFAKTHFAWDAWDEGVGLLARKGTIQASGVQALPFGQGPFPRKVIWAHVATPRGSLYLYSTHLTLASAQDRESQAKAILALVNQHATPLPQVVVGDFNDWYGSLAVSAMKSGPPAFTDAWGTKHPGSTNPGLTCCRPNLASRIDYIFVRTATLGSLDQVDLAFTQSYAGVWLSDHVGVLAAFKAK